MAIDDPRAVLLTRLGVLLGREEAISHHLRGQDGRLNADFGDISNFTAGDEVLVGLEDAALEEITQIRAALARIQDGTYGTCASCGGAIPAGRLAAMPAAALCVKCAA